MSFFFFNDTATTEIYTLSLHDALPIFAAAGHPVRQVNIDREPALANKYGVSGIPCFVMLVDGQVVDRVVGATTKDRKSTRLNSSHMSISYAVFCLKKKKK